MATITRVRMPDGRVELREGHIPAMKNPPLTALNATSRAADAERRSVIGEAVGAAQAALRQSLSRRTQKNLR